MNTVYLKGPWKKPFKAENTKKMDFYINNQNIVKVDMMYQNDYFRTSKCDELKATALFLSYQTTDVSHIKPVQYDGNNGEEFNEYMKAMDEALMSESKMEMIIIIPDKGTDLETIESQFSMEIMNSLIENSQSRKMDIYVPRFKIENLMPLNATIKELGSTDMFNPNVADLSGISSKPLFVADVRQKAIIEVNEFGTEAAAATICTVVTCCVTCCYVPPEVIKIDRPFMFLLISKYHDQFPKRLIMFMGAVKHPN